MAPDPRDRRAGRRETIDDELPVGFQLESIRRHKLLILLCAAFFPVLGLVYLSVAAPRYTAVAELVIDPKRSHAPENEPRVENLIDIAVLESHLQIARSEKIALAVIQNLSLAEDPEFTETGILGKVLEFVMRGWKVKNEKLHRALTKFKRSLNVRLLGRSYVIEIAFTSSSADKAARVANELATVYIQDQLEARVEHSRQSGNWLQDRIKSLREQMTNAFRHMEDLQAEQAASTREGHAKLRELEAEALTYKSMYEAFLNRYVQTVQQQSFPVTDARVVTKPRPPLRPSSPDPLYTVLLSLAAGLGFGSFVSFALEHRRAVRAPLGLGLFFWAWGTFLWVLQPLKSHLRRDPSLRLYWTSVTRCLKTQVKSKEEPPSKGRAVRAPLGSIAREAEPVSLSKSPVAADNTQDWEKKQKHCDNFLVQQLQNGAQLANYIKRRAKELGFGSTVLEGGCDRLGIVKEKVGFQGDWYWSLPTDSLLKKKE